MPVLTQEMIEIRKKLGIPLNIIGDVLPVQVIDKSLKAKYEAKQAAKAAAGPIHPSKLVKRGIRASK